MGSSMTGYGRGEAANSMGCAVVEIKTVNSRYRDVNMRLPRLLAALENNLKERIQACIHRGKVDVFVRFEHTGPQDIVVRTDEQLARSYADAIRQIARQADVPDGLTALRIAQFNDVLQVQAQDLPLEAVQDLLYSALDQALDQLCAMRRQEGEHLLTDIRSKIKTLVQHLEALDEQAPRVVEAYRKRLESRIDDWLGEQADALFSPERLAAEVALFADKSAVDEELVRLGSHLEQLVELLDQAGPLGKKADFLLQEINREMNTIGAKANDLGLVQTVVAMKSEAENIREQIQNLE